jgi:hypothetical protein
MNLLQQQHTDLFSAVDISSSYLLIEVRICEEEISRGNAQEAAFRSLNPSSNKKTACLMASSALLYLAVLCLLILRE